MDTDKAKTALAEVVARISTDDDLPGKLWAAASIKTAHIGQYSLMNRLTVLFHGEADAMGYRQWDTVGRHVKAGAKAIWILAPNTVTVTDKRADESGQVVEVKRSFIKGFRAVAVFGLSQTEGREYMPAIETARLPLLEVAQRIGVTVAPSLSTHGEAGSYSPGALRIRLCTQDEQTWLHELAHAVDDKLGGLEKSEYAESEVVAELSACAMASALGLAPNLAGTREYVTGWSHGDVNTAVAKALARVQKILAFCLETEPAAAQVAA